MLKYLNREVDLSFLVNPFYIYCASFSIAILVYYLGWSNLFPDLTPVLVLFFISSFILLYLSAKILHRKINFTHNQSHNYNLFLNDYIFSLIITLGILNVILTGYLPVLERSRNHLDFGAPVLDPLFNSLSIFFSVFFFQSFLDTKKKKYLLYVMIFLFFHLLIFRRSAAIWIITSSVFLYLLYKHRVSILTIGIFLFCLPIFSYSFGVYGAKRSHLEKQYVINDLEASDAFVKSGISHNHYLTYLYTSSPLANLQENIDNGQGFFNRGQIKDFLFYCIAPQSLTLRLEKKLNLSEPGCSLIHPHLITGTYLMISYSTFGWLGMISMILFFMIFVFLSLMIIRRWESFSATTFALLTTTASLLIFSNFLNKLDVILMLFVYPVFFHLIYSNKRLSLQCAKVSK